MNTCKECNNTPPQFTEKVLEIINPEQPVLFHRVNFPASLGDDTQVLPDTLNYKNVLLYYEANEHAYLYSSDGVPTFISMGEVNVEQIEAQLKALGMQIEEMQVNIFTLQQNLATETSTREQVDNELRQGITVNQDSISNLTTEVNALKDTEVQFDTTITGNSSTVTINKTKGQLSGESSATSVGMPLPVASETDAGVMNSATFKAVQDNSMNINSILEGAVALENLPTEPTQEVLTTAWQTATGQTQLINRASIFDVTNQKIWYYYTNVNEWYSVNNVPEVTVATATNDSLGIVKGGDTVFVEPDGSLTVVGLDEIKSNIASLTELVDGTAVPKLPNSMVYDFVSPAGANNPSTADNANITARVVNTSTGAITNATLMMPMASATQAGSVTAADKSKLDDLPAIASIGENLELTEDGVLNATGGGGATLYDAYSTATDGANTAKFINDTLNAQTLALGSGAVHGYNKNDIVIGYNATGKAYPGKVSATVVIGSGAKSDSETSALSSTTNYGIAIGQAAAATPRTGSTNNYYPVAVGSQATATSSSIAIGRSASATGVTNHSIAIGRGATANKEDAIAIGEGAIVANNDSIALGGSAITTRTYEVSVGNGGSGAGATRYLANITAGVKDTDAINVAQVRTVTTGDVLYASAEPTSTITLSASVAPYEKIEIIGSWNMPHTGASTPLQLTTHWHLNDQDSSRTFQLRAIDVDVANSEKTEVVDTWTITNATTIDLVSNAQISGALTDQTIESSDTPYITITKVIGIKAL